MTKELALARPDFPYLTLVDEEGKEYRMERQSMYKYSVTGGFSQKMKAYIKTPKVGENGNELTFGWENGTIEAGLLMLSHFLIRNREIMLSSLIR